LKRRMRQCFVAARCAGQHRLFDLALISFGRARRFGRSKLVLIPALALGLAVCGRAARSVLVAGRRGNGDALVLVDFFETRFAFGSIVPVTTA
jgi:hypothetical protein